jgi:hypothetical protein
MSWSTTTASASGLDDSSTIDESDLERDCLLLRSNSPVKKYVIVEERGCAQQLGDALQGNTSVSELYLNTRALAPIDDDDPNTSSLLQFIQDSTGLRMVSICCSDQSLFISNFLRKCFCRVTINNGITSLRFSGTLTAPHCQAPIDGLIDMLKTKMSLRSLNLDVSTIFPLEEQQRKRLYNAVAANTSLQSLDLDWDARYPDVSYTVLSALANERHSLSKLKIGILIGHMNGTHLNTLGLLLQTSRTLTTLEYSHLINRRAMVSGLKANCTVKTLSLRSSFTPKIEQVLVALLASSATMEQVDRLCFKKLVVNSVSDEAAFIGAFVGPLEPTAAVTIGSLVRELTFDGPVGNMVRLLSTLSAEADRIRLAHLHFEDPISFWSVRFRTQLYTCLSRLASLQTLSFASSVRYPKQEQLVQAIKANGYLLKFKIDDWDDDSRVKFDVLEEDSRAKIEAFLLRNALLNGLVAQPLVNGNDRERRTLGDDVAPAPTTTGTTPIPLFPALFVSARPNKTTTPEMAAAASAVLAPRVLINGLVALEEHASGDEM